MSNIIAKDIQKILIERFKQRMKLFGVKNGTKQYLKAQADFFVGACSAVDVLAHKTEDEQSCMPPYWQICIMTGREIEPPKEDNQN